MRGAQGHDPGVLGPVDLSVVSVEASVEGEEHGADEGVGFGVDRTGAEDGCEEHSHYHGADFWGEGEDLGL